MASGSGAEMELCACSCDGDGGGARVCVFVSELSGLVSQQHPQLAALLSCIQFASVAVVNLQYRSNVLPVTVYLLSINSH